MKEFIEYAQSVGLHISESKLLNLEKYLEILLEWNQKFNLTGIKESNEIWVKHFLDSITVLQSIPEDTITAIDIGTGAGFPGLVIAIMRPDIHMTLVDATGKKVVFLKHVAETLGLKNMKAVQARAEDLAHDKKNRENYDVVLSRAVAYLPTLLEYTIPFAKIGGVFIAQKKEGNEEIETSKTAIEILGGEIKEIIPVTAPSLTDRQLVVIKKVKSTPEEYPRAEGLAKKRPL